MVPFDANHDNCRIVYPGQRPLVHLLTGCGLDIGKAYTCDHEDWVIQ